MKKALCITALVETSPQALPLGAACIVSAIKNHPLTKNTVSAELLWTSLEDNESSQKEFINEIIKIKPDFLLLSIFVWNRNLLENITKQVKHLLPEIVTIAGGPEVTACPENFTNYNFTIAGEGEEKVPVLLDSLINNKSLSSNCCKTDLETLPSPYLDGTLDPQKFGGALWELARGCPFKCSYCYESKGEKTVRYFPMERIKKELELFKQKKVPQVFVLDPTYNASKKRALEMLKLIKNTTPDTFYYFEARAEFIDRDLAKAFSEIPCSLQFGLQSADEEVLKKVNRTLNKKKFRQNVGYLNETGVIFGFDLIYGLPGDTCTGFKNSIDFALSLYPNNLELFCLSVLPGTTLYDEAQELGLVWQKTPPYNVIKTTKFSEKDIEKCRKLSQAVNFFYNDGRAVPWFNAVLHPLKIKPSAFFEEFAAFSEKTCLNADSEEIEKIQLKFISELYDKKNLLKQKDVAIDLIKLNNALSNLTATGKESTVELNYHSDDLMSGYASDINFFYQNCRKFKNRTKVFISKNGPDWKVLK